MKRIEFLDGHRGLAILLVAGFHAFSRWPSIMPYGEFYKDFFLFKYGFLGVELFFMISGFVILMTLDKCSGIKEFLYRRWLRLFPAMLICTTVVFFTTSFFHERPAGQPEVGYVIPGLFFIEPYIWEKLFGLHLKSLEGAFWSLYVEFKFYIIASIVYFLTNRRYLVISLFLSFSAWFVAHITVSPDSHQVFRYFGALLNVFGFEYFGWFATGASYYLYTSSNQKIWMYFGLICALLSALVLANFQMQLLLAASFIAVLFHISVVNQRVQHALSSRFFLFFGFISYPFYLIHEGMIVSLIIKMNGVIPAFPNYLLPIVALCIVSAVSYYIAKYLERPVKGLLRNTFALIPSAGR